MSPINHPSKNQTAQPSLQPFHITIHLSIYTSIHPSIHPSIHSSNHPFNLNQSIHLFIQLSNHSTIHPSIHPSNYSTVQPPNSPTFQTINHLTNQPFRVVLLLGNCRHPPNIPEGTISLGSFSLPFKLSAFGSINNCWQLHLIFVLSCLRR